MSSASTVLQHNKNRKMALTVTMLVAGMFALAFAAFPLYNLFCKVTGYGGTTQQSETESDKVGNWKMQVRFNADTNPALPWEFSPSQKQMTVKTGENALAFYTSKNMTSEPVAGMATYNVTPPEAGIYFHKVHCFCFDEQTLQPHENVEMPVSFYIDPEIEDDPYLQNIRTITLSYTFFPVKD